MLPNLAPGATITSYWPVTYPPTFNVAYPYTIWATGDGGCATGASSQITTESQISATANKLQPTGAVTIVTPEQVVPGSTATVKIMGFTLGTIGHGPSATTTYDTWLQPVGNLDFDPTCVRLVRSEVLLSSVSSTPFVNRLYFSGLSGYRPSSADSVTYTFVLLKSCTTVIQPYQEAASGMQEKYNGDYAAATSRLTLRSSQAPSLLLSASANPTTVSAGATVQYAASLQAQSGSVGYPSGGRPAVLVATIAPGTAYVAGSATIAAPALTEYSVDGGATWSATEPANASSVTTLRWQLAEPVGATAVQAGFAATVGSSGTALTASFSAGLLDEAPLAQQVVVVNGTPPTPTPTPTPSSTAQSFSVQGAETGGLESAPLDGAPSRFLGAPDAEPVATPTASPIPAPLVASIGGQPAVGAKGLLPTGRAARASSITTALDIAALLPADALPGTTGLPATPSDVLAVTDAPDARAMNYVDGAGRTAGVALAILTVDAPYEHDYGVCNRFKSYTFDQLGSVELSGLPGAAAPQAFWHGRATYGTERREDAFLFHVFVDEAGRQLHVDSRWVQDSYPAQLGFRYDYVFNFQVWSVDRASSEQLLRAMLARLSAQSGWQLVYHNQPAATPEIYVHAVTYAADRVTLTLENSAGSPRTAAIHGTWRTQMERTVNQPVALSMEVPPGRSSLRFSFPGLLDTILFVEHAGFTDKIYSGGGLWFPFSSASADAGLTVGQCRSIAELNPQDLLLAGCVEFAGSAISRPDEVGLGRTLNPNGRPVDVSAYRALRFWARGDGRPVRVTLETAGIADHDFYQTVFTPGAEWREYSLPFASFRQRGFGAPSSWTGADVKAVVWTNADATAGAWAFAVDQVLFTDDGLVSISAAPAARVGATAQPVRVTAGDAGALQAVRLWYSLDEGQSWSSTPMGRVGSSADFEGVVPAQPLGGDVRYYVEALDTAGAASRTPVDAPASFRRYRVDDRPSLLVDDFGAGQLQNRLGGGAGLFNSSTAGGLLRAYQGDQQLILDYDVSAAGQLAGYATDLGQLDARGYTTLDLLVRGEQGGEQLEVGWGDASNFQPRRSVGALTPGGLAREWQWVQIPFSAFPAGLDRSALRTLILSFDHGAGATSGRIYVRELRLTTLPAPLVVDTFDGGGTGNGLGLGHWIAQVNSTLAGTREIGDVQRDTGAALRLDYDVRGGGYAVWGSTLGGAALDADAELSFWVRGADQALLPNVYVGDGQRRARVPLGSYVTPAAYWQLVRIPIQAFASGGVDRSRVATVELAWEFGAGTGRLWIDDLLLGAPGSVGAGQRVVHLRDKARAPIALHLGSGERWTARSDSGWLFASGAGAGPATLRLETLNWLVQPGTYSGAVTITTASGATEQIQVSFHVTALHATTAHLFLPLARRD